MVAGHGFTSHPADQRSAQHHDGREALHQLDHQRGAKDHQRNADGQTQNQQHHIAARSGRHGNHVIQAHDQIGQQDGANGGHHALLGNIARLFSLVFTLEQTHANPQQQQAANDFHKRQLHQLGRHHGESNTQHHRSARAEHDGFLLLLGRQATGRQRDHHRVVSRKNDVDPDDLEQADPEIGTEHGIHGKYS